MKIEVLLNHMWETYTSLNPHIKEVLDLIESKESSKSAPKPIFMIFLEIT